MLPRHARPSPTNPGYLTGVPINASTGQPWTAAEWLNATEKVQGAISTGVAVTLGGTYKDMAGNSVSTVNPGPQSGEVLTLS